MRNSAGGANIDEGRFRFGEFDFDGASGKLQRNGHILRLHPQPAKLLSLLLRRGGDLLTRELIQKEMWGDDTFVDFDKGIYHCIKEVRQALGDDAEHPRFIETVPRRGYRFLLPVEPVRRESWFPVTRHRIWGRRRWWLAGAATLPLAFLGLVLALRSGSVGLSPISEAVARQLTSLPGWEGEPAISPDGKLLAYASDQAGGLDLWVSDLGGHNAVRITDHPATDMSPAWFPDGLSVAFVSDRDGSNAIWKTSLLGGSAFLLVPNAISPAISPDGSRIAFVRRGPTGATRVAVAPVSDPTKATFITTDADGFFHHRDPAWSLDGTRICYAAQRNLWLVSSQGGGARKLMSDEDYCADPIWSPDGRNIYVSSTRYVLPTRQRLTAVWKVPTDGRLPARLTTGSSAELSPSVSRDGSRLVYSTGRDDNHFLALVNLGSGSRWSLDEDCVLSMPAVAPDGNQLAFGSDRDGGRFDLWLQPLQEGEPVGPPRRLTEGPRTESNPRYSPDGRWIAYYEISGDSRDIWIAPVSGSNPVQFTDHPAADIHPAWSPDGSLLAFASDRNEKGTGVATDGRFQIWIAPVAEGRPIGPARRVTGGEVSTLSPTFSPDGARIAFMGMSGSEMDVWMASLEGGAARRITFGLGAYRVRWDNRSNMLLVAADRGASSLFLWRVSPDGSSIAKLEPEVLFGFATPYCDFDISADGKVLCYMRQERWGNLWALEGGAGCF